MIAVVVCSCKKKDDQEQEETEVPNTYIDVHCHIHGQTGPNQFDFATAASGAIEYMDKWKIDKMIVMPPPFTNQSSQDGKRYEIDDMVAVLSQYPGRFCFLGGGEDLNKMIQLDVTGTMEIPVEQFKTKAREVAAMQGFVGFGEIATLHLCLGTTHVFQKADPDHELFLALVDVAAEENVPIDIHQEAVPDTMPFPDLVAGTFPQNPDTLYPNIDKFKTLLSYALSKNVKIIWDHAGWDNTKLFTAALCQELLSTYSNLYFSVKICPNDSPIDNRVVDANGNIKQEWLNLFNQFPTRFMIGADHFHVQTGVSSPGPPSMDQTWSIIIKLPDNLKQKFGCDNAKTIFGI